MINNKQKEKIICAILLILSFTIFSLLYVRCVVMPQNGWWHYFAYRMTKGDVLYKDIYLFIPPYFTFLTRFFYTFFGKHFILYILFVGYPIKVVCLLILYFIICRLVRPAFSYISVLIGACLSATYLMDVWYDYNPVLILPALLAAYCIMRFYECKEDNKIKRYKFSLFLGILVSILLFSKHSIGITFGLCICIMLIVLHKKHKISGMSGSLLFYFSGVGIGAIPALAYFIKFNCWNEFIYCMKIATKAKGGANGIFSHLCGVMADAKAWIIALSICGILVINKKREKQNIFKGKWLVICNIALLSILGCGLIIVFYPYMINSINYLLVGYRSVLLVIVIVLLALYINIGKKYEIDKRYIGLFLLLFESTIFIGFFCISSVDLRYIEDCYIQLDLFGIRRQAIVILSYIFVSEYFIELLRYFFSKDSKNDYSVLMFETLVVVHFFTNVISTSQIEELFAIMYIPFALAYIFRTNILFFYNATKIKNAVCTLGCAVGVILCLLCKLYIPYDWQGWRQPSISHESIKSNIEGLEGFSIPIQINEDFGNIVKIINENTNESDTVYQFANIPLFNVLTERKIPVYGSISWFDVCPDEIAELNARQLSSSMPKIVIWHNTSEEEWMLLENVFRNGRRSGQRAILEYYESTVLSHYEMVYEIDNNRDGTIQVWLRKN